MRRFTYADGGSHKFWSVDRDGVTVTVHFGRVGTAGQTQVKELSSDSEAEAHVAKLVTQKLKKGYSEDATETSTIEASTPAAETSTSTIEASPAIGETSASIGAAPASIEETAASILDEDMLVFPESWHELIHPRRGGRFVPTLNSNPARAWQLVAEFRHKVVEVVERRGGNVDLTGALAYADERAGTPHDAAVVATIVEWALVKEKHSNRGLESTAFVDSWIAERGCDFAARAVMATQQIHMNHSALYKRKRKTQYYYDLPGVDTFVGRFRAHLAIAGDEDHAASVKALGECRHSGHDQLVTTFLVPGRADWRDEAIATREHTSPLLMEALDDAAQLVALEIEIYSLYNAETVVPTMVDGIGPALVPIFARMYDEHAGTYGDGVKQLLAALAIIPTDEAFDALLRRASKRWVRPMLQEAMNRFPVRAARLLAAAHANPAAGELLRTHARAHGDLLAKADLPESARAKLTQFPAPAAEATDLPALLVDPPWLKKRTATKPAVVTGLTPDVTPGVHWLPGERERWSKAGAWNEEWSSKEHPNQVLSMFRAGRMGYNEGWFLATGPEELARQVLSGWRPKESWHVDDWLQRIAARYEIDALPPLLHVARRLTGTTIAETLLPFTTVDVAVLMADWLARLKNVRKFARVWFTRHPETAALALVPAALDKPGKERRAAEAALRSIDPAVVTAVAAEYGEQAAAGIATLLATDPLDVLPARVPANPAWLNVTSLPQLLVRDGGALPDSAVVHVVTMLAMSKPDEIYAGVDVVKELCTPGSLAEFAWGLFGAWQSADMPSKESWVLTALGWLGDDETVRRLTPIIRSWPGEGGHARAVNGLDVLAAIGTDVALMHLHGIAQKVKFTGLRNKAKEKIAEVAAALELTPDQLADRLVPDLGLDDNGSMVLDYGPRKFVVGFDERLTPYVIDDAGARRKDLPKPGARDDTELAPTAHKQFASLKKDVRTLAADQVRRLQEAMVSGRRWSTTEFTDLFVAHPLLRHVVRRLVWAHFDGADVTLTFRVAEDRTLAGVTDDEVTLPAEANIGIAHPLQLGDDLAAWAEIFADYEILQPFPQLGRPVHAFTDEERAATVLALFKDITVPTGKVLGLTNRGWERGTPMDGGVEAWIQRPVPGGRAVVINIEPGIAVGIVDEFPEQKLEAVWLSADGDGDWSPKGTLSFGELDSITASEVLTELFELTGTTRDR